MNMRKILKLFDSGNVCVVGLRGCGKDMLFANVVARQNNPIYRIQITIVKNRRL